MNSYKLLTSLKSRIYQETKILDLCKYIQLDHMPNRWTVSGGMVGSVSVWGPFKPPPFFQCLVGVHVLFCESSVYFLPSLSDHMGWLVIILVSSSYPPFECRPAAGGRCLLQDRWDHPAGLPQTPKAFAVLPYIWNCFRSHRQHELWITSYSRHLPASQYACTIFSGFTKEERVTTSLNTQQISLVFIYLVHNQTQWIWFSDHLKPFWSAGLSQKTKGTLLK